MILGSALDIMQAGRPPRVTFLDYPLGHSAGRPDEAAEQLDIVRAAVQGLEIHLKTEQSTTLPYVWTGDENWKEQAKDASSGDQRQPRDETPRYQYDEDRIRAEAG